VSPATAAADAIEQFDQNGDRSLTVDEVAASGAMSEAFNRFDSDGNEQLNQDEIQSGLQQIFGPSLAMTDVRCRVNLDRQPLADAKIRLVPEAFLGDSFPTAEGITDASGSASMVSTYPGTDKQIDAVASGLYRVEITSERVELPAEYSAESKLGCIISTMGRGGNAPVFELSKR
jgi:hypothetical protein